MIVLLETHSNGEAQHGAASSFDYDFERFGEPGQGHGLVAVGAGGDHADLRAGLLLEEVQIILRQLRQFVELGDAFGGGLPAFERGVDGLDGLEAAHVGGDDVGELAVDLVAGADGDLVALVHDVHLGDDQPFGAVDHVGVAEQRQVEPAAAARAAGDGAVLLAAGAEQVA